MSDEDDDYHYPQYQQHAAEFFTKHKDKIEAWMKKHERQIEEDKISAVFLMGAAMVLDIQKEEAEKT